MELIEEEKEAIKTLEEILKEWQKIVDIEDPIERECEMSCYMEDMPFYQIKILLKLVKKQQKEIKKLKDKCKELIFEKQELTSALLDSTPNDKIREIRDKAEVMDCYSLNDVIDDLSKLIGDYKDE